MSSSPKNAAKPALENPEEEAIITEICDYSEKHQIKAMLEEYMKRLILEQPKEPLKYLVAQITENPFVPEGVAAGGSATNVNVK